MNNLTIELLKRVFGNLGAISGSKLGQIGLVSDFFLHSKKIRLQSDSEKFSDHPVWNGSVIIDNNKVDLIISNIGIKEIPEFVLVCNTSSSIFGLKLSSNIEDNLFLIHINDKWEQTSILQQLTYTSIIEIITQQGLFFEKSNIDNSLYEKLLSIIEED